jgi:hypothetical protein
MKYIRDIVHERIIDLPFYLSSEQIVEIFAKMFTQEKFHSLKNHVGVEDTIY